MNQRPYGWDVKAYGVIYTRFGERPFHVIRHWCYRCKVDVFKGNAAMNMNGGATYLRPDNKVKTENSSANCEICGKKKEEV